MNIQIKFENIESDERLKQYVNEKVSMLAKYLGGIQIVDARAKLSMTSKHHQKGDIYSCEIALTLPGTTLRVERTTADIFKAVDKVKDHLVRSIKRYKEKNKIIL